MSSHVLAGDIGGTKTKLAIYDVADASLQPIAERVYPSRDYALFADLLADFQSSNGMSLATACLGVAGPVYEGRCVTTNLPWEIDEASLATRLGIPSAKLLNDLEAMALGMLELPADAFVDLNPNVTATLPGNKAAIAAGTGCGEALLYWDGANYHAIATESGHGDFAPNTVEQDALLQYLRSQLEGHVSYERILSGPGIVNIYRFLRDSEPALESPEFRDLLEAAPDPGQLIGGWGVKQRDRLCTRTLSLFAQIYGAESGNLALRALAVGGVLIGGGIAPKLLPILTNGEFFKAFCDKGRFSQFMRGVSVKIALHPDVGLLGAASCAQKLAKGSS